MVHTLPDGTTKYRMVKVFGSLDTGELAARLGSLSVFDRRGDIVWYDDFESATLDWFKKTAGTGAAAELNVTSHFMGSQSLRLTTGNAIGNYIEVQKQFRMPSDYKIGFEAMIDFYEVNETLDFDITLFDGTKKYEAGISFDNSDNSIKYNNSAGNRVALGTMKWSGVGNRHWIPVKLVVDFENKYYVRAIVGEQEFPMSTYAIYSDTDNTVKGFRIILKAYTLVDYNKVINVDNVILTQNE